MTGNEVINTSDPLSSPAWELPPLYKRINWAALLVPPIGVILFLLAAMYLFPYVKKRLGHSGSNKSHKEQHIPSDEEKDTKDFESVDDGSVEHKELLNSHWDDDDSLNYSGTIDRLQSTPRHKFVPRTTPTPSPKLGRLDLSASPQLASQENICF